jgi:nucleotide-binding universal stress UspA family protein
MTDKLKRRRKPKRGKPNALSADVMAALAPGDGADWGPKMKALPSDRHRIFVLSLYQIPRGHGAQVKAAKMAGFGTATTSANSWSVIASRLAHDDKILEALREEDERRIRASAPRAIRALEHLIETPDHKDHGRAIGMVLDRVHPAETTHTLKVEHRVPVMVATAEVLERIAKLAARAGLDPLRLAPPIDAEFVELPTDKDETDADQ